MQSWRISTESLEQERTRDERPKLTKNEKSFLEALDPSWSYILRNGRGQLYLGGKENEAENTRTGIRTVKKKSIT